MKLEKRTMGARPRAEQKPRVRATPFRKPRVQRFREVVTSNKEIAPEPLRDSGFYPVMALQGDRPTCTLMDLSSSRCRWPLWADAKPERLYCGADGADMENKLPYCPLHSRMAYRARAA